MAEEALGKSVKQLKKERTTAKSSFTKQANFLCREAHRLIESELKEEFKKLSSGARKVFETNDDYKAGLIAEIEATEDGAEVQLSAQQEADFKKAVEECNAKFDEVTEIVQDNLWRRYGQSDVLTTISAAEKACDRTAAMPVDGTGYESYEVQLELSMRLVKEATVTLLKWERWIPAPERKDLESHVRKLKECSNELESRKAEFAWARRAAEDTQALDTSMTNNPNIMVPAGQIMPVVKIKPTSLPKFTGIKRDYYRWKRDWENLQKQGEPTGSVEVKKIQLVDSVDDRIAKELRLSSYNTADDIFRVLDNRYGNKITIAMEIVEELEKMPALRGNQPRRVIELIQMVEKALADLTDLGNVGAMKNPLVIKSIESKLPELLKREWLVYMTDPANNITPDKHFDELLQFLQKQEEVLERLEQLRISERVEKPERKFEKNYAFTRTTKKDSTEAGCIVCGAEKHRDRIFFCRKFKDLKLTEKKSIIRKLGACKKCLGVHEDDSRCSDNYLCRNKDCKKGDFSDHHYFLCPKWDLKNLNEGKTISKDSRKGSGLTAEQEHFLAELSPELAEKCKKAFTNKVKMINCSGNDQQGLVSKSGLKELPVIMMLMEVTTNAGQKIGALIDLASDTNYITHEAAERLKLRGEKITLVVHGVGKMAIRVSTNRYLLRIRVKTPEGTVKAHQLICYGLEEIAKVHRIVSQEKLREFFPEVELEELKRPGKIDLLISHREGRLAPQRVKIVGDLVLWDSPLGKTVAGAHPDLFEVVDMAAYESKTHFARSMRTAAARYEEIIEKAERPAITDIVKEGKSPRSSLASNREFIDWWKWDSIGTACEPKCGGCRCGNCQPGGKEMTLAEERELEIIREGLTYVEMDTHSTAPHWDTKYPWIQDPATLPYNRSGVEAAFLRTEKQLKKVPEWQDIYAAQVHDMLKRGAATKLTKQVIEEWKGPVWYVSHLVAPNPHSTTTPVRLVWNSSQKFKGLSMNDLLLKGPDVLNPIRAVLLRFRKGVFAALGDIKKMYNSVWLEEREVHLHRFLWRDTQDEEISEYAITRVNIGDRPAGCIAQLAMRETARLAKFAHLKEECRVLEEDSYVDDILTSHNSQERLKEITNGLEEILAAGGFALKPWVRSEQSGRNEVVDPSQVPKESVSQSKTIILPNQLRDEDNKALGTGYLVEEDKLYIMASINFSVRKKKMRTGQNLLKSEVRLRTPNPLTRRHLLSQVAGLYDPVGLVTPAKQKGAILVRKAFQETGKGSLTRETWDMPLSENLREEAIRLFEEYVQLNQVKFHRSLTPPGWKGKPWGITFSDGSDKTYGAVLYLRWNTDQGIDVRLVESKAKLTPLDQKGDAVKAEICGAVFAARLRKYFEKHGRMKVERWFHLVDSQTVLGAIQRDSYGYQTFFANRVGEIQKSGSVSDWWWIPGDVNIADIITRGGTPEDLAEESEWQEGPQFLRYSVEEWPKKSAAEVAADAKENVNRLQRKTFSAVLTRSQTKRDLAEAGKGIPEVSILGDSINVVSDSGENGKRPNLPKGTPRDLIIKKLVDEEKYSNLTKLVRVIGWVWRAVKKWLGFRDQDSNERKRKEVLQNKIKQTMLTVKEEEYILKELFLAAQQGVTFPDTTLSRLAVYRENSGLLVCGGRIQIFNEEKIAVPILPCSAWVSMLLAREAHSANHEEVAGTLLRMRKKAWVIKGRRLAKKVVDSCVICRKARAKRCEQIMADLPPERTEPAAPFEYTTLDLFGPYIVKDEVRKRVHLKVWGIVYCCMASRAIHTDIVSDQSAEGFMLAYQRFTALRGHPRKLWSDPGSNFIGVKPALTELYKFLDKLETSELEEKAAKHGTEWVWKIHPASSPHRNGAAEAAVRIVKRALHNLGGDGVFTWSEFQTFLYMAANLANERPIDARTQSREDCVEYVTPNSLLLGRSGPKGDPGDFDFVGYPYKRLKVIQGEVNKFWRKWSQLAGPNLFVRNKWHTKERNVAVGDVVWLADQNALRSQYKLARVIQVNADDKGIVRDVNVKVFTSYPVSNVKPAKAKVTTKKLTDRIPATILHRDVRRLVVLIPIEEQH
ncbi:uncharacterized protein [Danio rerio]|uniref:Uncharacterized protein n=1 Tax=Danio rerio TaxID=7955 RepID=A0AC58IS32_DANRE